MRDDFTNSTKIKLALRAGAVCSNPLCRRSTFGAKRGKDGYHNIGVAAHITAAAPGGPRYDATLTRDQRRHADNGIWLCQTHGDLVDGDDKVFTVKMLQEWKHDAERRSSDSLLGLGPVGSALLPNATIDALENQLGVTGGSDIGAAVSGMLPAATGDIMALKRMSGWPRHPVELNLHLREGENTRAFNVSGLAAAVEAFNEFAVVAPPGTGKTTTLIQVVDAIHVIGRAAALFIPLGEWSLQDRDFLASVLARPAFRDRTESDLQQLAEHGRLVLMLDGWNELDADGRKRATVQLRILQRDYPRLCVVISTRREALDLPLGGQTVDIDLLSEEQQLEIAHAIRGDEGAALVDAAGRTKGVRELVTIPLYLTALLVSTPGDRLPTTKEEILRLFAKQHEGVAEKAGALRDALFGFHPQMLTAIAVEATQTANTAISDTRARAVVRAVEDHLTAEGQITAAPQPTVVLDVLVGQHTLVRSGAGVLSFQHQQFQEWYASFEVEHVMRTAAAGDVDAARRLRVEFLDQRAWEEAVLFACERLSREGNDGAHAVAHAIVSALSVDPLLAAEMIYRSADAVWNAVSATVVEFVQRWHKPGQIDRAVSFMVASGRAEFAATIWPLIESQDQNIYLSVIRAARLFRPSVLGPDAAKRLTAIPEKSRGHVLGELAERGGIDGMDLATGIAKADPSLEVQFEVIQSLLFRQGNRHANDLLETAPDGVWALLSKHRYSEEITAPSAKDRLQAARAKIKSETTAPAAMLGLLLDEEPSAAVAKGVEDAIASKEFPMRDDHGHSILYRAFERYPEPVAGALLRRLEAGIELPYSPDDYLSNITRDDGPIAALALDAKTPEAAGIAAARVAGPNTTQALMDAAVAAAERLAGAPQELRQSLSNELRLWEDRLAVTPEASFVAALLARATEISTPTIGAIASAVSRHGPRDQDKVPLALADNAARVVELMRGWAEALLADTKSPRYHLSSLAMAIGRLARPELLEPLRKLRDEDARRRREAQAQTRAALGRASIDLRSDASTGYNLQYRDAFARIGEPAAPVMIAYLADDDFGFDAACVLKEIYDRVHGMEKPGLFKTWPHLPDAPARRTERTGGPIQGDTGYSDAIFAEIERLIAPGSSEKQKDLAIMIARMAIAMPYRGKEGLVERLVALPRPVRTKRELVASLVMAGETFSADMALTAISDWIEDAKQNRWRFDQGMWEVTGWLELLPFSDRPEAVLEGVKKVMDALPHPRSMERVVTAAGAAPGVSEDHLQELFRHYPRLASQHEWAQTFLNRGTVEAVKVVLAMVNDQRLGSGPGHVDIWWLSRQIASFSKRDAALLKEILRIYEESASGPARRLLEGVLQETGGAPAVLALVKCYAQAGNGFDGSMHEALQHTAVEERPIPESNAYNLHPVSVATLRKELFAMMHGADSRVATIAEACLSNIDYLRDYMGAVESEPRHPDITSGKPWPREAGNVEPSGDAPAAAL